jgi:hypothetical protein
MIQLSFLPRPVTMRQKREGVMADQNDEITKQLKQIVFLLTVIAGVTVGAFLILLLRLL